MQIEIKLNEKERLALEYAVFAYDGIRINFEQYMRKIYEYDDEMFRKLTDVLIEKYSNLQKQIYKILDNHGYKNIKVSIFSFYLNEGLLKIGVG